MKKSKWQSYRIRIPAIFLILFLLMNLTSCFKYEARIYYRDKDNYVNATGVVSHMKYSEEGTALYFGFDNLSPKFDDNAFKIEGDNLKVVQDNGIDEKIKIGDEVSFMSAPKYFGDGYIMPIMAISIGDDVLLEFEQGYENYMNFLKK